MHVNELRVIAFTHKNFPLDVIGRFHIKPERREEVLGKLKAETGMQELIYLSTCNRVEFIFTVPHYVCPGFASQIVRALQPSWTDEEIRSVAHGCERYNGMEALDHLLRVASSLDSVILGEREIITQLRKSFEESADAGLSSEVLRLVIKQCIKTSKEIFTHTDLSRKPVSAVSLAWQEFQKAGLRHDARVLVIGAGQVTRNFCKFLSENQYRNITIANRTLAHAEELVNSLCGTAIPMSELESFSSGFDVLVSCTASEEMIVSASLYHNLLNGETGKKLLIDLALPADMDAAILEQFDVNYIGMSRIQQIAAENLAFRQQALSECEIILSNGKRDFEKLTQQRQIELAMQAIPEAVKDIRNTALGSVFAKDLEQLDEQSREVIEKIMAYMEKKYISIPMKMAREVLMNEVVKN